jgi:hypothetical protein
MLNTLMTNVSTISDIKIIKGMSALFELKRPVICVTKRWKYVKKSGQKESPMKIL